MHYLLYMRKLVVGRQTVYYMVGGPNHGASYYRDGFPQLVNSFPSFFCTMKDAAQAAAEAYYLVLIGDELQ